MSRAGSFGAGYGSLRSRSCRTGGVAGWRTTRVPESREGGYDLGSAFVVKLEIALVQIADGAALTVPHHDWHKHQVRATAKRRWSLPDC